MNMHTATFQEGSSQKRMFAWEIMLLQDDEAQLTSSTWPDRIKPSLRHLHERTFGEDSKNAFIQRCPTHWLPRLTVRLACTLNWLEQHLTRWKQEIKIEQTKAETETKASLSQLREATLWCRSTWQVKGIKVSACGPLCRFQFGPSLCSTDVVDNVVAEQFYILQLTISICIIGPKKVKDAISWMHHVSRMKKIKRHQASWVKLIHSYTNWR